MLRSTLRLSRNVRTPNVQAFRSLNVMKVSDFANIDPNTVSEHKPHAVHNFLRGHWVGSSKSITLPDPLNGEKFITVPDTQHNEADDFISSLNTCSKSGLHNPFKHPERYVRYGTVCANAATAFRQPEVNDFLVRLIQRVAPKSEAQARAEVFVTMKFLETFGGDQVRFLARSFQVPGDHAGQMSSGYRWPFGPVVIIAPFNFPLEIPMLQLMGALFM
eukprot:gene19387-22889_t